MRTRCGYCGGKKTHPIGRKKPNPRGLFDMHGNVAEWCQDLYAPNYYQASPEKAPRGPEDGNDYVLNLMEHINPAQDWGATGGVPPGVTVALNTVTLAIQ